MASKLVVFGILLISISVAHCHYINHESVDPVSFPVQQRQPKLLPLSTALIGSAIFKLGKVLYFVLTSAYAIVGFKLAALALLAHGAFWVLKHAASMVIGAVLMFGFCKVTGKCGPFHDVTEEAYYYPYLEQAEQTWRRAARLFEIDIDN